MTFYQLNRLFHVEKWIVVHMSMLSAHNLHKLERPNIRSANVRHSWDRQL